MVRYIREHTNPPVFIISGIVVLLFVAWGLASPGSLGEAAAVTNTFVTTTFGWMYIFIASFFIIFVLGLLFTRYGRVKLGPDDSRPEFSTTAWFAMLFTAGMGIGLVFYGVAEPRDHFLSPPTGDGSTAQAADNAMLYTFFHWGLHPWAIYIVLGLALGYFAFRRGLPLRPASALYPLIGNRIYGPIGHVVDIIAVFGTIFGLATSLGLGAGQVGAGTSALFGWENTPTLQVTIIALITAVAVVSVMFGIDKGIRNLSLINLWLAVGLMLFVFIAGPSLLILNSLVANVGLYAQNILQLSFQTYPDSAQGREWLDAWTLFYWGWWLSWSPFVGMFIARISYGRTIRQFITGVLLAPVGASMVWFTVFGSTALQVLQQDPGNALSEATADTALFELLNQLPVAGFLTILASVVGIIVVVLFFATSSDSGSLVVDILTNGGDPNPRWQSRFMWAVLEGAIAAALLIAGAAVGSAEEALTALQTASIVAGLPLAVVLVLMCFGLMRGLRDENLPSPLPDPMTEGSSRIGGDPPREAERAAGKPTGAPAPHQSRSLNQDEREGRSGRQ